MTPEQRVLAGRMGAHRRWAREPDPRAATAPARQRFMDRFADQVRATNPGLSAAEVERRAGHLRKAYFTELALASSQARSRKTKGAPPVEGGTPGRSRSADPTSPTT